MNIIIARVYLLKFLVSTTSKGNCHLTALPHLLFIFTHIFVNNFSHAKSLELTSDLTSIEKIQGVALFKIAISMSIYSPSRADYGVWPQKNEFSEEKLSKFVAVHC